MDSTSKGPLLSIVLYAACVIHNESFIESRYAIKGTFLHLRFHELSLPFLYTFVFKKIFQQKENNNLTTRIKSLCLVNVSQIF